MSVFTLNKSSFERFGDDLSELILSFLPITDKLRYECVSKQFQRLVFNKQHVLDIHVFGIIEPQFGSHLVKCLLVSNEKTFHKTINKKAFECVLKKFNRIKSLNICDQIRVDNSVIALIANNCHHLQELIIDAKSFNDIDESFIKLLGQKCGQKLKSIDFSYYCSYYNNKSSILYGFSPNIKEFCFNDLKIITSKPNNFYTKLEKIVFGSQSFSFGEFTRFVDSYCNQIKSISISIHNFSDSDEDSVNVETQLFKQLSRFIKLENLWLDMSDDTINYRYIAKDLESIAMKCKKLKFLDFEVNINNYSTLVSFSDKFCKILSKFKSLVKCKFVVEFDYDFEELDLDSKKRKIECLDPLLSLESLHLNIPLLTDKHFDSIDVNAPKLAIFEVTSKNCVLTDKTLLNLAKIKTLSSIDITKINADIEEKCEDIAFKITDIGFIEILKNCPKIEKLEINDPLTSVLTAKSIDAIIALKINPKIPLYTFSFYDTFDGSIKEYLNQFKDDLPQNLEINCFHSESDDIYDSVELVMGQLHNDLNELNNDLIELNNEL